MPAPEDLPDNAAFRAALRRERIALRLSLPADEHAALSANIEGHLGRLLAAHAPGVLAFCWPIRAEFDCRVLTRRLIAQGWHACIPAVIDTDAPMKFRAWSPDAPMTRDRHGIPVPADGPLLKPDVILLPVVAFDRRCFRLGYGGGYFDRTLAALTPRPLTVGVGFELARIDSIRPQPHDLALDAIVTEAGVAVPENPA